MDLPACLNMGHPAPENENATAAVTFVFALYFQCSELGWVKWQFFAVFASAVPI